MKKFVYILIVLALVGGVVWLIMTPGKPGKYDQFAQCLTDKGVKFYGAFWCPHCQAQKARFGKSVRLLPYIECSTPDGQGQLPICKDVGVTTYPTWDFPPGLDATASTSLRANDASTTTVRVVGELELSDLAEKTSCTLPQ